MTYWNPVRRYGVERFAADLAAAGGAGLITPDLIPDAADEWIAAADAHDLDQVFLVAPVLDRRAPALHHGRLPRLRLRDRGDGRHRRADGDLGPRRAAGAPYPRGRGRCSRDLPVGVGLGVSDGDQAAEVASYADGVIVGSAFVRTLLDAPDRSAGLTALTALTEDLADGVRGGDA